jgi:hypothetical protein
MHQKVLRTHQSTQAFFGKERKKGLTNGLLDFSFTLTISSGRWLVRGLETGLSPYRIIAFRSGARTTTGCFGPCYIRGPAGE